MSLKIVAVVALALLGTLAVYHAHHSNGDHHAYANQTFLVTGNGSQGHYVPNYVIMYHGYKLKHGLKFGAAEDNKRLEVFIQNAKVVEAHNAKESSYKLGLTALAHLTREEFSALKLGYNGQKKIDAALRTEVIVEDDKEVDWVKNGAVTPIKNQGSCGSCWAFSTVGALEGLNAIKNKKLVSFSEQDLVDCSASYGNQGCNGGLMDQGFQYVADKGIATEESYPYTGVDGTCQDKTRAFKIGGFKDVTPNDPNALVAALNEQPVSVAIEADTQAFQLYSSGVLTGDACGTQLDHGVLAVGYGTLNGKAYFKVKNSWGPEWGQNGFILIGKASGAGICGINSDPSYPTL